MKFNSHEPLACLAGGLFLAFIHGGNQPKAGCGWLFSWTWHLLFVFLDSVRAGR
jgi:hypothetical protein